MASTSVPVAPPTRVLTLEHAQHGDDTLLRFAKGVRLRFQPGPSLLGRRLYLHTNYAPHAGPDGEGAAFERSRYWPLRWRRAPPDASDADDADADELGEGLLVGDEHVCCDLLLTRAGAYHYYFVYDAPESGPGPAGSGWFQVEPALAVGGAPLPLDAVCCQTVLARCLGPLARWQRVLRGACEARYNMVHVTPVHALGASGSAYCVADQLRLDPGLQADWPELAALLARLNREHGLAAICDVVLNHTANETPWLDAQPEATYNCANCAHLRPAALLDALVARVASDAAAGALPGVSAAAPDDASLRAAADEVLRRARLAELHHFYQCDADALQRRFVALARDRLPPPDAGDGGGGGGGQLRLVPDPQRRHLAATVDMELALRRHNARRADCASEQARAEACGRELRRELDALNAAAAAELDGHLRAAAANLLAGARYERLQHDGPRLGALSARAPLFPRYFAWPEDASGLDAAALEALLWGEGGARVRAHNGWVMDADPLEDFAAAAAEGRVYLRRELLAWGDSVKLRYGAAPEESAFLWAHMARYVRRVAATFAGLRLDNCHSTPLHVAERMMDEARSANPDLYVVAELFTNSPRADNIFVNRLGITALIREAQSAWDAHELGRLVHRFGGRPVGAFERPALRAARPRLPRALLVDQTHDNPAAVAKRCVLDLLPTAALVAMACCAAGSTRGYDELVPHAVSVVDERRPYAEWRPEGDADAESDGESTDLRRARRALNELHAELARCGYDEVFVDQMTPDVVAVTRHNPRDRRSVILVAATAFRPPAPGAPPPAYRVPPLRFEGELEEVALEAALRWAGEGPEPPPERFTPSADVIDGLRGYRCELRRRLPLERSAWLAGARGDAGGGATELAWRGELPAGAVLALRVRPAPEPRAALEWLQRALDAPAAADPLALHAALRPLGPVELNALLFRCDAEERDASGGRCGVYEVPGHGPLPYAGLVGPAALLARLRESDDLGHPLCANARQGDWLAEHTWRRLRHQGPLSERLAPAAEAYRRALEPLRALPRFLQPAYLDAVLARLHAAVEAHALRRLGAPGRGGPWSRALALASVQLVGAVPSAPLPAPPPLPPAAGSMAAGLPHFATGYMRCWGRDTFVALPGLLLLPARWADARAHLLGFAACLRHGLLPNLLDGGARARFNCRDALWWWLHALQLYAEAAPEGDAVLDALVPRLFPTDDAPAPAPGEAPPVVQPLHALVQEALQAHFEGRAFRERGAGPQLDAHMADEGFVVRVGVHPDTGFVFGGSEHNAGTWMDKMGSSQRAGTRGKPATPRDGSAIELVALSHAALLWLHALHAAARYPHAGVARSAADGARTAWTWRQWAERVQAHFERRFWVPAQPSAADDRPDLVHRRAIYKDSVGASRAWADYQLRPNCVLAMAASPALFSPERAWAALDAVERHLLGGMGLRTLDPDDYNYRARYDPADDGPDPSTAHGYNYHQGPQWVWPLGAYLRARLHFAPLVGRQGGVGAHCLRALAELLGELRASPWQSLPELAHADGARCEPSCRAQAWSCGAVLEALHALRDAMPSPSPSPAV